MKTRLIRSEGELDTLARQIMTSATSAVAQIVQVCTTASPIDVLRRIKFEPIGYDPLSTKRLNLIEQINQTFTYLATLQAVRYLLLRHPDSAPFTLNLGTASGYDICSQDGKVIAEVFAAVTPNNNDKLRKDVAKANTALAQHKYVFCSCLGLCEGDISSRPDFPNVKIVSLGTRFGEICTLPTELHRDGAVIPTDHASHA